MKKQDVWACEHGCPNDRVACEHLEKLLPSMSYKRLPIMDNRSRSMTFDPLVGDSYSVTKRKEEDFLGLLRQYGVYSYWDTELLVARYVYGMSLRQIKAEYHFKDLKTAFSRLRELRRLLVERGLKPRRRP